MHTRLRQPSTSTMSQRRKSTVVVNHKQRNPDALSHLELERLEQETTLVMQEIDRNLSKANGVITDKIFPMLTRYHKATSDVWKNTSFWKKFVEDASDAQVCAEESNVTRGSLSHDDHAEKKDLPSTKATADNQSRILPDNSTETSDLQMEASTPQLKSRHLLQLNLSPQRSARRNYPRVSISPKKRSSNKYTEAEARRLSMLQNFLNSSPTLPEPPKLQSELNYSNEPSSNENPHQPPYFMDSEENQALRLLPIALLPPLILQKLTKDPPILSSESRPTGRKSQSPSKTAHFDIQRFKNSHELPPSPRIQTLHSQEDSDEFPLPKLQTIQLSKKRDATDEQTSNKKQKLSDTEAENVFLDANNNDDTNNNSRNHSAVYNAIVENQNEDQQQKETHDQSKRLSLDNAEDRERRASEPSFGTDNRRLADNDTNHSGYLTANLPQNVSRQMDSTVDSSELGSFFGERWKALSKSLGKSDP